MLGMKGCLKKKTKKVTMSEARTTPISEKAEEILRKPYARMIFPEDDGTFRGEVLEFPGCIVSGESAPEALCNLEEAANSWVSAAIELGQTIPEPVDAANNFSGRLVLRIPKSLHKKSSLFAEREGVSLNQFIATSLSESVGEKQRNYSINTAIYSGAQYISIVSGVTSFNSVLGSSVYAPALSFSTLTQESALTFLGDGVTRTGGGAIQQLPSGQTAALTGVIGHARG